MAKGHIEVPNELKDFLTVESCSDFPIDRYLLTPNQRQIGEDIVRVSKTAAEMRKLNLDYLNATLLYGPPGTGKAQPMYSKVLTPAGFIPMQQVKKGTVVITPDGDEAVVAAVYYQGIKPIYEITFDDKTKVRCSYDHLWEVQTPEDKLLSNDDRYVSKVMTLKDISIEMDENGEEFNIRNIAPIPYKEKIFKLPVSKYADRLLSGDIVEDYLYGSIQQRKELFDTILAKTTDGVPNTIYKIIYIAGPIAQYIAELARTLGIKAIVNDYGVKVIFDNKERQIKDITYIGDEECQCIYIDDAKHLYITDEYIVTHNTTFGRYLAYKFGMDFAFLNFANLIGGGILGSTAQNITQVFSFMKNQRCIFMLDEIDCISTRRGQESAATGGELSRTTITVMQELDRYKREKVDTIIIAATNRIEDIDLALQSRFAIKQKIIPWNNDQKEVYANKFLQAVAARSTDGEKLVYNKDNIHEYCVRNSTLQQREIEADITRCIAGWIASGLDGKQRRPFVLDHIKER